MSKDSKVEFRCSQITKQAISDHAKENGMSVGDYIETCCIPKRITNKRKQQMTARLCVQLTQMCNDLPELKQQIGGIVCQLKECL